MGTSLPYATSLAALVVAKDLLLDLLDLSRGSMDPIDALILQGVIQANVARVGSQPELQMRFATLEALPPDSVRRPVSITGLSGALGLAFETVRRRLIRMSAAGLCDITPAGVVVPERLLGNAVFSVALQKVDRLLEHTYRRLTALGFFDNHPLPAPRHPPGPEVPYRAEARIAGEYLLRLLPMADRLFGGLIRTLIVLQLVRENTSELGDNRDVYGTGDSQPWVPEHLKRPASVTHIAAQLRLQNETVRRHMRRMTEEGLLGQVGRGYIVLASGLSDAGAESLIPENNVSLRRLYRDLARIGAVGAWGAAETA